jgi:hypothetical protein
VVGISFADDLYGLSGTACFFDFGALVHPVTSRSLPGELRHFTDPAKFDPIEMPLDVRALQGFPLFPVQISMMPGMVVIE